MKFWIRVSIGVSRFYTRIYGYEYADDLLSELCIYYSYNLSLLTSRVVEVESSSYTTTSR